MTSAMLGTCAGTLQRNREPISDFEDYLAVFVQPRGREGHRRRRRPVTSQPPPPKFRQYVVFYPSGAARIGQLRSTHMKSYILYNVSSAADASTELDRHLSRSGDGTWVLLDEGGDAIAYFIVGSGDRELPDAPPERVSIIQADISGRHFYDDAIVLSALKEVQDVVGGVIRDDDDAPV
jgi:hypothetical protein